MRDDVLWLLFALVFFLTGITIILSIQVKRLERRAHKTDDILIETARHIDKHDWDIHRLQVFNSTIALTRLNWRAIIKEQDKEKRKRKENDFPSFPG